MPDILFIVLLALVIFGPRKLPELASHAGRYLAQFRKMKRELADLMEAEMRQIRVTEEAGNAAGKSVAPAAQTVANGERV